jgi:hypothetical protein
LSYGIGNGNVFFACVCASAISSRTAPGIQRNASDYASYCASTGYLRAHAGGIDQSKGGTDLLRRHVTEADSVAGPLARS